MRSPPASSEAVRKVMRANRSRDTRPELLLRAALRAVGLRGYRVDWRGALGRPDVCWPGRRVAVFVHGCFWHSCPACRRPGPRANAAFWREKLGRNLDRDARVLAELEGAGWRVLVLWEHEVVRDPGGSAQKVAVALATEGPGRRGKIVG